MAMGLKLGIQMTSSVENMKESGKMKKEMDLGNVILKMELAMKVNGKMMNLMEKENLFIKIMTYLKGILEMAKLTAKVSY